MTSTRTLEHTSSGPNDAPPTYHRRWIVLAVLCVSLLIIVIDTTIVNVALPSLVAQLHADVSDLQWVVDGYTVVFAGLLLLAGTLADRFGRKRCLTFGLAAFAGASAAAALAPSVGTLVAARTVMGGAAAFIMPSTLSILANVFTDERERSLAIGIWSGVVGLGVVLGPLVGGALLDHFWWGAVFVVNVPVALGAILAGAVIVPESHDTEARRTDWLGAALSVIALVALVTAIIEAPASGWTSASVVTLFVVAASGLALFVLWEARVDMPMLDVRYFRNARFSAATATITFVFFSLLGFVFLSTQYLQFVLGYSPFEAGLGTLPFAAAMMVLGPFSSKMVQRLGTKAVVVTGMMSLVSGLLLATTMTTSTGYPRLAAAMALLGAGLALSSAPATDSIMGALPANRAGVGSAVNDTAREVGGALGVAVLGSIVASAYRSRLATTTPAGVPKAAAARASESLGAALQVTRQLGHPGAAVVDAARDAFMVAMARASIIAAVVGLIGAVIAQRWLPSHASNASRQDTVAAIGSEARPGIIQLSPSSRNAPFPSTPRPDLYDRFDPHRVRVVARKDVGRSAPASRARLGRGTTTNSLVEEHLPVFIADATDQNTTRLSVQRGSMMVPAVSPIERETFVPPNEARRRLAQADVSRPRGSGAGAPAALC